MSLIEEADNPSRFRAAEILADHREVDIARGFGRLAFRGPGRESLERSLRGKLVVLRKPSFHRQELNEAVNRRLHERS